MVSSHTIFKWMTNPHRLLGISLLVASCILLGCEADTRDDCGGLGGVVSCVSIDSIVPIAGTGGTETSNVDAVLSSCSNDDVEEFTDHNANITFSNHQFPASTGTIGDGTQVDIDGSLLLTIVNYTVSYTLNHCPSNATGCPALTGFSVSPGQTFTIPNESSVTREFPMVPLRVKEEYVAKGGQITLTEFGAPFPSYTATYVFTGRTDFFSDDIRIEGSTEFTIGNFDSCP